MTGIRVAHRLAAEPKPGETPQLQEYVDELGMSEDFAQGLIDAWIKEATPSELREACANEGDAGCICDGRRSCPRCGGDSRCQCELCIRAAELESPGY